MALAKLAAVVLVVALDPCAANRVGTVGKHDAEATEDATTGCGYVAPEQAAADESYPGMASLTDLAWTAPQGEADGKNMLFYAYGPMFKGKGQVGAWKYNPSTQFIEYYYAKSHCQGMCDKCCDGGKGNTPGVMSVPLNPSASVGWTGYTLSKKFAPGATIETPFGNFVLNAVSGAFRLSRAEGSKDGCYLDHIFACSQDSTVAQFKDMSGKICDTM